MASLTEKEDESLQDTSPSSSLFDSTHHDVLPYLINEVYHPFIVDHVNCREILHRVTCMRDHAGVIHSTQECNGQKEAALKFMDFLKARHEQGKYQEFFQALKDCEYFNIVNAIENGPVDDNHDEHKKILEIFSAQIEKKVDAVELSQHLLERRVISHQEERKIRSTADRDPALALFDLIDAIPRRNPDWFAQLWDVLFSMGQKKLCELLNDKWYNKRMSEHSDRLSESDVSTHENKEHNSGGDTTVNLSDSSSKTKTLSTKAPVALSVTDPLVSTSNWRRLVTRPTEPSKCECHGELLSMKEVIQSLTLEQQRNSMKLDQILSMLGTLIPKTN